ncbi:hypothetical protein K488DRAFT_88824 [Vararia minispora EC-137]|uniref:Uncharacterized protein n=1 Tax=Vararia minispora EC-137 TaxID=1314806 RepID=A0ACB8QCQ0_9AGAM|nr:hypothetical protein K488DRAFT_88824 [Vararia minispora EC-137]
MNISSSACTSRALLVGLAKPAPRAFVRHRSVNKGSKKVLVGRKDEIQAAPLQRGGEFLRTANAQRNGRAGLRANRGDNPSRPPADLSYIKDIIEVTPFPEPSVHSDFKLNQSGIGRDTENRLDVETGALLEVRRKAGHEFIVYAYPVRSGNSRILLAALSHDGSMTMCTPEEVTFVIHKFLPSDQVSRIGELEVPTTRQELMARVMTVKKLRDFSKAYQDVYSGISGKFHTLYDDLAPQDPEEWGELVLQDVFERLDLDASNDLVRIAAHNHLMDRPDSFLPHQSNFLNSTTFHLRPRAEVARIQTFWRKLSTDRNFLDAFAERVRDYIAKLRQRGHRDDAGVPSCSVQEDIKFTEDDQLIVHLLRNSLRALRTFQADPYETMVPLIIKAVGRHGAIINDDDTRGLLIDLGVFAPWQDTVSCRWDITSKDQSGRPGARDAVLSSNQTLLARSALSPHEYYPSDPLEAIRHDFGSLPAYVIDDVTAHELDDGISVERDGTNPDYIWVHVHIADPTRLLHPDHELAKKAARVSESLYFLNRFLPMFPSSFISENSLSLGTASAAGEPEHTMSFSGKIAPNGEIVDYRVHASILRNIRVMRYDEIDAVTGWETNVPTYPFGGQPPAALAPAYGQRELEDLKLLREVFQRRVGALLRGNSFVFGRPKAEILSASGALPDSLHSSPHPGVFRGWPDLTFKVTSPSWQGARAVVAEAAKIACTVASMFALERGLPMVRRAMKPPLCGDPAELERLLSMRDATGCVPEQELLKTETFSWRGVYETVAPDAHWGLDVPEGLGYARVSSPLRRYVDMLHHWQLKHALLHPDARPLFSKEELQGFIKHPPLLVLARNAQGQHMREWTALYVQRYLRQHPQLVGGDGPGPLQSVDAIIKSAWIKPVRETYGVMDVTIPKLGLDATLRIERGREYPQLTPGSVHRVDIVESSVAVAGSVSVALRK